MLLWLLQSSRRMLFSASMYVGTHAARREKHGFKACINLAFCSKMYLRSKLLNHTQQSCMGLTILKPSALQTSHSNTRMDYKWD